MPFLPVNPDYGTTRNQVKYTVHLLNVNVFITFLTSNKSLFFSILWSFLTCYVIKKTFLRKARQKLGRLESREFNTLVLDVLKEIRRRQTDSLGLKANSPLRETGSSFLRDATRMGLTKSMPMPRTTSGMSDDEPIYDHVNDILNH
jgi:hypothetical protein